MRNNVALIVEESARRSLVMPGAAILARIRKSECSPQLSLQCEMMRCDPKHHNASIAEVNAPARPLLRGTVPKRRRLNGSPGIQRLTENAWAHGAQQAVYASAETTAGSLSSQTEARQEVLQLASYSSFPATSPELEASLKRLVTQPTPQGGQKTLQVGQGTWEVISAPHIARLSETLGSTFSPIRYTLKGDKIASNVRYNSSVFKEGWLSASGTLLASDPDTVQVKFDRFWVDFGVNGLREDLTGTQADAFGDSAIGWIGRLFFFPQLSLFPVLYVDSELAVFAFPPLRSNIAVRKIS